MNTEGSKNKEHPLMSFEWQSFVAALALMTRIPAHWLSTTALTTDHQKRSQIWYPAVGLAIGALLLFCIWILPANLSPLICAGLILTLWVMITGALHLDGLADMADAWAGGMGDKQRTLDIMKDPACGPHAVISLIICLLLKYLLVLAVIDSSALILLLVTPMLARGWILPMLAFTAYASKGMASDIARERPKLTSFCIALAVSFVLLALFVPNGIWVWLITSLLSGAVVMLIRYSATKRLGGYTGDVLGASIELNEVALLLGAVVFLSL